MTLDSLVKELTAGSGSIISFKLDMNVAVNPYPRYILNVQNRSTLEVLEMVFRTAELTARAEGDVIVLTPMK